MRPRATPPSSFYYKTVNIHADAYAGYDNLFSQPDVIEVGCWCHARRRFDEALSSRPLEASEVLGCLSRVYALEDHIEDITEARQLGDHRKLNAQLVTADLLVIDDLFLRKLPTHAGDELADVIMARHEKASTVITSNRPVDDWGRLLGDLVVVTPLLDRLMHHGHLLRFEGKSWRLKEAAARAALRANVA